MQPMHTHNLTQAQDPGTYTYDQSKRGYHLLAHSASQGSLEHLHRLQAQFCYARL